jgi:hypothetical protein
MTNCNWATFGKQGETDEKQPPNSLLCSICFRADNSGDYVSLNLDISKAGNLYLLLDSSADLSVLKSRKLVGTSALKPRNKVKDRDRQWVNYQNSLRNRYQNKKGNFETPSSC